MPTLVNQIKTGQREEESIRLDYLQLNERYEAWIRIINWESCSY